MRNKTYSISDLFYTDWRQVKPVYHALVFRLYQSIKVLEPTHKSYGYLLIMILRHLRKNPLLVDKINEAQAVDIFNDLTFLKEPWYFFPAINGIQPEEYLARHTFDHFIYADNEFTSYLATEDRKYLYRLVATLYQKDFDKESVAEISDRLRQDKVKDEQLDLVFYTYSHVREFVTLRCKKLLPKPRKQADDIEDNKVTPTGAIWLKIKHRLSETPAFQGYDNAGRANMYSALDYLEDLAEQKENGKP